jgi:putative transposase
MISPVSRFSLDGGNRLRRCVALACSSTLHARNSAWITDNEGFAVSESTVYRVPKREGLAKRQEIQPTAANEYHTKTTRPHQMWATDASYFKAVGWGYYYLVTVMDDYSRFILGWKLQKDMSTHSMIEVVQEAVDTTGMTDVPVENRTRLLSDNGSGYVYRAFRDYLNLVGIGHTCGRVGLDFKFSYSIVNIDSHLPEP